MKLLKKEIAREPAVGVVKVQPDNDEDVWHLYNVLVVGDVVTSSTFRKVDLSSNGDQGGSNQQRIRLTLSVKVEAIEYDGEAAEIRLRGRVTNEVDQVRVGSYHTC